MPRADREPPASWLGNLLMALQDLYPGATLSRGVIARLKPWWADEYRRGATPRAAARSTCACNGKEIVPTDNPSDKRRALRPPKGARAGEPFGLDDMRPTAQAERLGRLIAKSNKLYNGVAAAMDFARKAPTQERRQRASDNAAALQKQLESIEAEIAALKAEPKPRARNRSSGLRRARCGGAPACSLGLMGGTCGIPGPLLTASAGGTLDEQQARYCLIDAFKVITSHDPLKGFAPRPSYPPSVQERRYDADRNEQLKVLQIAQNLRPELIYSDTPGAIDGMPVLSEDGIALGGNGRSMAIQLAYADGTSALREYLKQHAKRFGLTRADIESVEHPTIVRVVKAPKNQKELAQIVRVLNMPLTGGIDQRGLAVAQSRALDPSVLTTIASSLPGDADLADYLEQDGSRSLVNALRRTQIINARNANILLDPDGLLNRSGRAVVQDLLLASLIPDAALLERLGDGVINSLTRSAPFWLSAGTYNERFDVRAGFLSAARDLMRAKQARARTADQYLSQGALFGGERAAVSGDPLAEALFRILFESGMAPLKLIRVARGYSEAARRAASDEGGFFATDRVSPVAALRSAASEAGISIP